MRQLACLLQESPAPDEAGRLRRRPGPHLRDGPLQRTPALGEAWAGNVTNFPNPGELAAPGVPRGGGVGGRRRAESGPGEAGKYRKQPGKLKHREDPLKRYPGNWPVRTPATRSAPSLLNLPLGFSTARPQGSQDHGVGRVTPPRK